ncbi:myotubularin-related protein 10-B [Drosophila elegans]|uniref:myotubularin-related protein 10-B n=1 Tax=Drosophila elegans TaxID=30023 RepID=UPI0007E88490|nr:myotubularin-related protein 10-B [Drosophila elegans]XP_017130478.1 myotubularin-related protein 10-B [Drosophila elegans]XP_017130479.1 myotubularin-related protein 10-B [Drosophila elegans]XP_041566288.1 myotubularin-related protein 10-B [Drosophila elegans]
MATGSAGGGGGLGVGSTDHHKRNTFTSYVAPLPGDMRATADTNEWCLPSDLRDVHLAKPRLLQGEQIVASAPAYMYSSIDPMDSGSGGGGGGSGGSGSGSSYSSSATAVVDGNSHKEATFGLLSVTNFKLAFVPLHAKRNPAAAPLVDLYQENAYLGRNEITLNNIDHIYTIAELGRAASALQAARGMANQHGSRRKKLEPFKQHNISGRIAALHIVCKNFRLLKFAFQQQDSKLFGASDQGKLIASALVRFAYPMRHDLSFAYAHREPYYSTLGASGTSMYATKNDWARELIRCGATEWQVVSSASVQLLQNPLQASKYSVPPHFVIPKSCSVDRFLDLSRAFCDSRAAFWTYSYGGSAALVRLAELQPAAQQDTKSENVMLELVRKCDVGRQLILLQLTDRLPSIQDVLRAYHKLRRLCTPETPEKFMLQDDKYLGLLEKTNWLFYVSLCLRYASEAAATLRSGVTCVLQESNGRDLCCVISSLAQLLLDPHFRTIDGFQSLVQKEWVALEHPFQRRLGHVYPAQPAGGSAELLESEQSPVFLLFLDCVWQLLQQFPDEFEFTQTYLTSLWDACFMPIFDTFQFDTQAQRLKAVRDSQLVLRPVWDWGEQFSDKDKMFFSNPLYQRQRSDLAANSSAALAHRRSLAVGGGAAGGAAGGGKGSHGGATPSRNTINPQLFATASSVPQDRFLQPAHRIFDLQVWDQCYYRWLPVLDIRGGGQSQVDLFHRLLLSNIAKVQRCLEFQNYDDLPDAFYEATGESRSAIQQANREDEAEFVDGVERRRKAKAATPTNGLNSVSGNLQLSTLSSFFPFGNPIAGDAPHQLYDVLSSSSELLMETSSFLDKSSIV